MVEWSEQGCDVALRAVPEADDSADVCFLLSYGKILPNTMRKRFLHTLVVHESNLPAGRGWSPMTWQILEGRREITVTLFEAADRVDAGRVLLQCQIHLDGTELHGEWRRLQAQATFALCDSLLRDYPTVFGAAREQTGEPTYYCKRSPDDSRIDPARSLESQFDLLRTVDNERYPAWFELRGQRYRLAIHRLTSTGQD